MIPLAAVTGLDAPDGALDALNSLHTLTIDSRNGFEKMVDKAEPEFRPVVERFRSLHHRQAGDLAAILAKRGHAVEDGGSMMGTLNEAVVSLRSFFDDIDEGTMPSIRRGEEHVLNAYAEALRHPLGPDEALQISSMRDDLVALLAASPV